MLPSRGEFFQFCFHIEFRAETDPGKKTGYTTFLELILLALLTAFRGYKNFEDWISRS
jgi:hypothetical protein